MRAKNFFRAAVAALSVCLLSSAAVAQGEGTQTGWLELVKGSRDDTVGAELVNIEDGDTADTQKITLAIPKASVVNRNDIEEVVVIGQRPPAPEKPKPVKFSYEWVSDYDNDNYGLVIHLGKDTNWPIRLYLNSAPGFID
ncbi:MAG: hypothetical protein KDI17_07100 [Halioglobus sp.]|nr:hypothetical protein [Halioglobus sp.]